LGRKQVQRSIVNQHWFCVDIADTQQYLNNPRTPILNNLALVRVTVQALATVSVPALAHVLLLEAEGLW